MASTQNMYHNLLFWVVRIHLKFLLSSLFYLYAVLCFTVIICGDYVNSTQKQLNSSPTKTINKRAQLPIRTFLENRNNII